MAAEFATEIEAEDFCINTAELIGAVEAIAHCLICGLVPRDGTRLVFRCDNDVACGAVIRWGANLRAMHRVLRILKDICDA